MFERENQKCTTEGCSKAGLMCFAGKCCDCRVVTYTETPKPAEPAIVVTTDPANHPAHYTFGKFEVLDVIEDWALSYGRACVIKYVARAGRKNNELEDLKKARFYIEREIARLESK